MGFVGRCMAWGEKAQPPQEEPAGKSGNRLLAASVRSIRGERGEELPEVVKLAVAGRGRGRAAGMELPEMATAGPLGR